MTSDMTSNITSDMTYDKTSDMTSNMTCSMISDMTSDMTSNMTYDMKSDMTSGNLKHIAILLLQLLPCLICRRQDSFSKRAQNKFRMTKHCELKVLLYKSRVLTIYILID